MGKQEFDVGRTWKVQFNDSFNDDTAVPTCDDAGNTTDDGLFKHTEDSPSPACPPAEVRPGSPPILWRVGAAVGRLIRHEWWDPPGGRRSGGRSLL